MTYILADSCFGWDWLSRHKEVLIELGKHYCVNFVKSPGSLFGNHYEIEFNSFEEFNKFCKEQSPVTLEECAGKLVIYI